MSQFAGKHLLSSAARENFVSKLKQLKVPKYGTIPKTKAAVLVPLCNINDSVSVLYTVRSTNLKNHSGQISFPGGKTDANETPVQTALRETREEIGLPENRIDIWTEAPGVPGVNNSIFITPVVGTVNDVSPNDFQINTKEVTEIFSVSLESLCNKENQFHTQFKNGFILPVFKVNHYKIWGVTAYITHLVLSCLLPRELYTNDWLKQKIIVKE